MVLSQVILAVLGACAAVPFIPDAPDVAAEKARFFSAFRAAEAAAQPARPQINAFSQQAFAPAPVRHQAFGAGPVQQPKWTGPVAATVPAGLPGSSPVVAETNEVAAARNSFFNAYQSQLAAVVPVRQQPAPVQAFAPAPHRFSHVAAAPAPQHKWTGPLASSVPAGLPGSAAHVAETPEVAAAKNAFFSTYHRQLAATAATAPRF